MEKKEKHIADVDQLLNEYLVSDYKPSHDFVNKVMTKVELSVPNKKVSKVWQIGFRVVAAVAVIFFLSNSLILLSNIGNTTNGESTSEWTSVYEQQNTANWYEYYNNELFVADNNSIE